MSKKATKSPAKAPVAPQHKKKFPKTLLFALLAVAGAFAAWKFWPKGAESVPYELHGTEETLTAKNPILQLLPAAETGIDFQNQIPCGWCYHRPMI